MIFVGIDPGSSSGGAAAVDGKGRVFITKDGRLNAIKFEKATEHEIALWLEQWQALSKASGAKLVAAIESVNSMPGQGVSSTFKFGMNYGFLRGLLVALKIPFNNPRPAIWQTHMKCLTRGDKKISRAAAHRRWPKFASQIDHRLCDCLLLADWMRLHGDLGESE